MVRSRSITADRGFVAGRQLADAAGEVGVVPARLGQEEILLRREVPEHRARRHAGRICDLVDRHGAEAACGEEVEGDPLVLAEPLIAAAIPPGSRFSVRHPCRPGRLVRSMSRSEHRRPCRIAGGFERDLDRHPDVHRVDIAVDDVGHEAQVGLLDELDDGDDVRHRHRRVERVAIDGEGEDRSRCRSPARRSSSPPHDRAHVDRGMHPPIARCTMLDHQTTLCSAGPERPTGLVDVRWEAVGHVARR